MQRRDFVRTVGAAAGLALVPIASAKAARLEAETLYVAPAGDDTAAGTEEAPFATLHRALEAVRARRRSAPKAAVTVYLRAGTYYFTEPVVLEPEDSGLEGLPLRIACCPGEEVIVSGGRRLDLDWQPYRDGIWQATVPGELAFEQLFVNGRREILARYPNYDPAVQPFDGFAADADSPERVKRWKNPVGGYLHALHGARWGSYSFRVQGKNSDGTLKLKGGWQHNRPEYGMHERFKYVEGIFEELDAPREWYLDREQGVLYYYPPEEVDLATAVVEVPQLESLFELRGSMEAPVRHIAIEGLKLRHTRRTFMKTREPLLRSDWRIYRGGAVLLENTEDVVVRDNAFEAPGGNAVFVSNYSRRVQITGNCITQAGAGGVCLVGDPGAVRSPSFQYREFVPLEEMDFARGPKTDDYPSEAFVANNWMNDLGIWEKQTAGVQISMARHLTIQHNTIYNVPRAGINIGDGTWGGHLIEYNDVFHTVQETSDHGAFNSWGRDRWWHPDRAVMEKIAAGQPELITADAVETTVIRNNRWHCTHGWDIDLDDGSSNYEIYDNLCLGGGIKLREGFYRSAHNNIMVQNTFHPHVWFENSGDVFVSNILGAPYQPIRVSGWGREVDYNLHPSEDALERAQAVGVDEHGKAGDPQYVNPQAGDYRVKDSSPALTLGFENFAMERFGAQPPAFRAEIVHPSFPEPRRLDRGEEQQVLTWHGATIKNLRGLAERSATGMAEDTGVLVVDLAADSPLRQEGLRPNDVILAVDGYKVETVRDFLARYKAEPRKQPITLTVFRNQQRQMITVMR